ncbi:hypothetical protein Cgig2_026079 [Carnegiea gigantea]|uniref:Leucine-rich repeat-containing N-terminal plant-type domain-containing protein n=1 Tax=Carnegiea gigantea TaxID=171969 RepID=A0A9Q1QKL5_9CARY|nr:hypothetical protein Cgig2_026079 [Carnegiea gigantea]
MVKKEHKKMSLPFITIAILVMLGPRFIHSTTLSSEVAVLRSLKQGIDPNSIPEYSYLSTWDFSMDPCESAGAHFLGVLCMISDNDLLASRITALDLDGVGYDGFLTEDIGTLTELTTLNLSKNKFRGPIPDSMTNLSKLTTLKLSENVFTGSIPTGLRKLKKLQEVDLSYNKLTGSIPSWISSFRSMAALRMSNNGFSGRIPSLAGLWQLYVLDLSNNELHGSLPPLPTSLRSLSLAHNVLSGPIHLLWRLRRLRTLDLSDNRFTGSIRGVISLPDVTAVNLSYNWFTELEVPKFTGRATALEVLELQANRLQGRLPVNLVTVQNLTVINLSHNQFSGPIPRVFGLRLGSPWKRLYLNHNFLAGSVPPEFANSKLKIKGNLAYNCLKCPRNNTMCNEGQRPASECIGQIFLKISRQIGALDTCSERALLISSRASDAVGSAGIAPFLMVAMAPHALANFSTFLNRGSS